MSTTYRLLLEIDVPDVIAPNSVARLVREVAAPGSAIRCTVLPRSAAARPASTAPPSHTVVVR
jgi:hypothetical protein